jgi:hypothetical protein
MQTDRLGDWRIDTVVATAEGNPGIPAGLPVRLMSLSKHKKHKYLSFVTPSASALALNIAINAAAMAEALRPQLLLVPMLTADGNRGFQIRDESISNLYAFFEQSMIAVTLSFQAVELFANSTIGRKSTGNFRIRGRKGIEIEVTPADAERTLSTEEKLRQVLPSLLQAPSPVGKRVWQTFKKLKSARDSTVHLKSNDMYTVNQVDRESLFFYFFNTDAREHPEAAIKVISHFCKGKEPRWLGQSKLVANRFSVLGQH